MENKKSTQNTHLQQTPTKWQYVVAGVPLYGQLRTNTHKYTAAATTTPTTIAKATRIQQQQQQQHNNNNNNKTNNNNNNNST